MRVVAVSYFDLVAAANQELVTYRPCVVDGHARHHNVVGLAALSVLGRLGIEPLLNAVALRLDLANLLFRYMRVSLVLHITAMVCQHTSMYSQTQYEHVRPVLGEMDTIGYILTGVATGHLANCNMYDVYIDIPTKTHVYTYIIYIHINIDCNKWRSDISIGVCILTRDINTLTHIYQYIYT